MRLISLLLASLLTAPFAQAQITEDVKQELCAAALGVTLRSYENGVPTFFTQNGIGIRGFLGAFPQPDPIAVHAAYSQGLFWWGHSFKVVKTVAEAKADDSKEKHNGSGKISYLISDVDVSDLPDGRVGNPADEENLKIIQARFREVIANTRMIYWDDSNQILGKDPSIPPMMFEIPREVWGPLLHPSTIGYYSKDHIGPRFNQSGWVFPRMRGEVTYKNVFESGSGTINKLLKAARSFVNKGGKIEFNRDFKTSLDHARDQWRFGEDKDGNKILVPGSSRYLAPDVYQKAVDAYKAGIAFSVEVRDPDGKLVAGSIGFRYHNVVSMDTIFYNIENNPEKGFPSRIDEAKFAVLAGTQRLNEAGINVIDGGMVTPFTAGIKGEYVAGATWAADVSDLQAQPFLAIDFDRPWDPAGVEVTSPAILAERERNAAHQAAKAAEKAAKKNTERDEAQAKAAAQELKEDWN